MCLSSPQEAKHAMSVMDGKLVLGRNLVVKWADEKVYLGFALVAPFLHHTVSYSVRVHALQSENEADVQFKSLHERRRLEMMRRSGAGRGALLIRWFPLLCGRWMK